jgi:hypothetical protein
MSVSVARTLRRGESEKLAAATTGATVIGIPNYGVSNLSKTTVAESYVLDAPVTGVEKTIFVTGVTTATTSVALTVRGSTGTSVKFGGATQTQFTVTATSAAAPDIAGVTLVGINSTLWGVAGYSTGIVFGTS